MNDRPPCFVLMPFGQKSDPAGGPDIGFGRAYEEHTGGRFRRAMSGRLLPCDFAVAENFIVQAVFNSSFRIPHSSSLLQCTA